MSHIRVFSRFISTALVASGWVSSVAAQQPDSSLEVPGHAADSVGTGHLSAGCQIVRVTILGLGGYVGYLIGSVTELPALGAGLPGGVVVGAEALGAVAGAVLVANAPIALERRLPLCPASLRTVSGRPPSGIAACRAMRLLDGAFGAFAGAIAAGGVALPLVLSGRGRRTIPVLFVTLPVVGAVGAAVAAGHRPPCGTVPPGG